MLRKSYMKKIKLRKIFVERFEMQRMFDSLVHVL
jgi:hypothetical protein